MSELVSIFLLSLLAMFTPTLLAAVTVMMLLPNPKKLMLGYLLGAYTTSISLGLLIVFSLHGSASVSTAKHTLGPAEDIVVGLLALLIAYVLGSDRDARLRERRQRRKEVKAAASEPKESWPERMLGRGSARVTFAVGVLLTFPGVSYLTALDRMAKLDASVPRLLLDPAAAARAAAVGLYVRAGVDQGRRGALSRLARPQRSPGGGGLRHRDRRPARRPWRDHAVGLALSP